MSDKLRRILIYGGNFLGKGAEAMLLTVHDTLSRIYPQARFLAFPLNSQDQREYEKLGFDVLQLKKETRFIRLLERLLLLTGLGSGKRLDPCGLSNRMLVNPFCTSDIIIDISGFASGDKFSWRTEASRWQMFRLAKLAGNKIIFMPQSWGPFSHPLSRFFTKKIIADADVVFAREKKSYEYLKSLEGIDLNKIFSSPDIAFQFRGGLPEDGHRVLQRAGLAAKNCPLIGITPNMQIYKRTTGVGPGNGYFKLLTEVIRYFLQATNAMIVLIPHEFSWFRKNDPELCQELKSVFPDDSRVISLAGTETAKEVKSVIGLLDFLVASRYHSLIAALSLRIPVVVIGWAHKYDDVMEKIELGQWVIDFTKPAQGDVVDLIARAWNERRDIQSYEEKNIPELEEFSNAALEKMIEVVGMDH
jgi:polysaccharide pyruvyl transferase WcaK-like protein